MDLENKELLIWIVNDEDNEIYFTLQNIGWLLDLEEFHRWILNGRILVAKEEAHLERSKGRHYLFTWICFQNNILYFKILK